MWRVLSLSGRVRRVREIRVVPVEQVLLEAGHEPVRRGGLVSLGAAADEHPDERGAEVAEELVALQQRRAGDGGVLLERSRRGYRGPVLAAARGSETAPVQRDSVAWPPAVATHPVASSR